MRAVKRRSLANGSHIIHPKRVINVKWWSFNTLPVGFDQIVTTNVIILIFLLWPANCIYTHTHTHWLRKTHSGKVLWVTCPDSSNNSCQLTSMVIVTMRRWFREGVTERWRTREKKERCVREYCICTNRFSWVVLYVITACEILIMQTSWIWDFSSNWEWIFCIFTRLTTFVCFLIMAGDF